MGIMDSLKKSMEMYDGKEINRVKVIGVRTGEQTKTFATENFGVYSFLVEFTDGSLGFYEETGRSVEFKKLVKYLVWE